MRENNLPLHKKSALEKFGNAQKEENMTVYMVKKDKHTTVRTTQLHEARKIAKQVLINKLKDNCNNTMLLVSTKENLFVYQGETQIRFFATMKELHGGFKTYSTTIKCIPIAEGEYDLELHKEIYNGYKNIKGVD